MKIYHNLEAYRTINYAKVAVRNHLFVKIIVFIFQLVFFNRDIISNTAKRNCEQSGRVIL